MSGPAHLDERRSRLRRGLRAKQRQLGGAFDVLVWECAYEQWHRLLFARFLAESGLLRHPEFGVPVTLAECDELAGELGEPDGWGVAARFAAEILPGIFRLDDPCVQLRLAPEHRVALERIVEGLPGEVFAADDSLGWVYQYWQSERKDEVNASEVKIGGADLGPVTQLFTENYMVRFLLENSLGAWWAARHPDSPLIDGFEYLRFDEDGRPAAGAFEGWPDRVAEVTVMDPCCGSGHFLVEAFGMLWRMRVEEEGLDAVAAQDAVLRDNLFGLELDSRCVQIAMFAVALQAWKAGGGWRVLPTPNIACSGIPAKAPLAEWTALADGDVRLELALERLHTLFKDADTLGSLIDPRRATEGSGARGSQRSLDDVDFDEVAPLLEKAAARESDDPATAVLGASAAGSAHAAQLLSRTYTLISTNVPYLSRSKQEQPLRALGEHNYRSSMADLSTMFLERSFGLALASVTVTPQNWQHQRSYAALRRFILASRGYHLMARLGNNCWQNRLSNPLFKFHTVLSVISRTSSRRYMCALDIGNGPADAKADELKLSSVVRLPVDGQLSNPEARLTMHDRLPGPLLEQRCSSYTGVQTGDSNRYIRYWWEAPPSCGRWINMQSTVLASRPYSGREYVLNWDSGRGDLSNEPGAYIRNLDVWGKSGIAVKQMGDLHATLYTGEAFDNNVAVLIPHDFNDRAAVWSFVKSAEYSASVRSINARPGVTTADLVKVPFDVERWRRVAAEEFPEGLPEPWSDDPTQWLFEGRPEEATEPLQVAVGRLVGYRWPEQPDADDLDGFADVDGIVCVPAVAGELPAADRVQALLARAYGDEWSPGLVRRLLEETGSRKDLAAWLRDDFFKQHCKVFSNRPFVWHIWDGRRDGFSALVNYHRLDRAGLERLAYTYLGDWIERQRAAAAEDVTGADVRLAAARELRGKLEAILEGESPYDIYVRWKPLSEQPVGWDPDLDDGVRLNIRPFVEAGVLRSRVNVHWRKDRGKNPDGSGRRNDLHYTRAEKHQARRQAGRQ